MFPAVKEGMSASRWEQPNNRRSWNLVLVCQMIIYFSLSQLQHLENYRSKDFKRKSLFNSHSLKIQIIISKYKYGVLQGKKITTGSFWFLKILFLSGPSQEMHYFVKLGKTKLLNFSNNVPALVFLWIAEVSYLT